MLEIFFKIIQLGRGETGRVVRDEIKTGHMQQMLKLGARHKVVPYSSPPPFFFGIYLKPSIIKS